MQLSAIRAGNIDTYQWLYHSPQCLRILPMRRWRHASLTVRWQSFPLQGGYVFSPTNGLWRTKSRRATVTAELCVWLAHEIGCVLMLRYGHMKMSSRFWLVLSLVATWHDAVTKCWGTFVNPCRGQGKTISTILTKVGWKRFRERWNFYLNYSDRILITPQRQFEYSQSSKLYEPSSVKGRIASVLGRSCWELISTEGNRQGF